LKLARTVKRIVQNGLTLEKAGPLSQEMAKANSENAYGYEPDAKVVAKDIKKEICKNLSLRK
jgi:hypothetical protein